MGGNSKNEGEKMDYDDVIVATGGFGRYQQGIYFLLCLSTIPCAFHMMAGVFLAAETDFRCLLPHENPGNATYQLPSNLTRFPYPQDYKNSSKCERYYVNLTDQFSDFDGNLAPSTAKTKCDSFVYDKTTYELTTTIEFNLVCDNAWLRATADSLYMVGVMLGSTIFGGLSDIYGRKPIFYWCICLQAISGLCIALSPGIIWYVIFRLLIGSAGSGIFQTSYVSVLEMVTPDKRTKVGIGIQMCSTIGYILTAGFAYFIRDWRILQAALTVPSLGFFVYWWFIPESGRWLVSKGRLENAKYSIQKAASSNGVELSEDRLDSMLGETSPSKSDVEKTSILDLWRHPNLRRKSLLIFFNCFVIAATYFGLAWNTSSLVGDAYLNFALSGLVEIPSCIFVFFTLDRWGRKKILCSNMFTTGIFLLLTVFIPSDMSWLNVTLTMLAKLAITAALIVVFVFAAEQYPTVIRNIGVGVSGTCGSIGGSLSPYIMYSSVIWGPLPILILGFGSLIAGLLALLLPETLGQKLPETIEDSEQFGKGSKKLEKTSTS